MFLDVAADRRRCLVGHGPDGGHVHVEESTVGAALQQKVQVNCEKLQDQEPILRLLNLQLQRQCCNRLDRRKIIFIINALCY
jgi:hypothetical protein